MAAISWRRWNRNYELVGKGVAEYGDMLPMLNIQEKDAEKVMRETNCKHVLYGLALFDRTGHVSAVHMYIWPMNEKEFMQVSKKCRSAEIYAIHSRR